MFYIKKFISEYENNIPGRENMLEALVLVISNYIIRSISNVDNIGDKISEKFQIEKIIGYMHQYFCKKLSNLELSKSINMSESHFIRVFKKETGIAQMQYLTKVRIEKAKKLLKIDDNEIKDEISDHPTREFLKAWKDSGTLKDFYKTFAVFKMKNGIATAWTFEKNLLPKEEINL